MTRIIIAIITAALSSSFLSSVFVKLLDQHFLKKQWEHEIEVQEENRKQAEADKITEFQDEYGTEKKSIYMEALERLAEISFGFEYQSFDDGRVFGPRGFIGKAEESKITERINDMNDAAAMFSAKLRLYATDDIYNLFSSLSSYNRFAYAPSQNAWHLGGTSKGVYNVYVTLLARLMQEDLGFRKLNNSTEQIECPKCGAKHDPIQKCPVCGIGWNETIRLSAENSIKNLKAASEADRTGKNE